MALRSPIELPTSRQSFQNPRPDVDVDIHDPQWIPVLSGLEVSPFHTSTLSPFSIKRQSESPSNSQLSRAPESIAAATRVPTTPLSEQVPKSPALPPLPPSPTKFELPAGRPTSEYFQRKSTSPLPREDIKDESTDTEATAESSADQSTVGTASLLDEQTYSIPGQPLSAKDDVSVLPPLPLSSYSSFSSLRKTAVPTAPFPAVPTSKYSRKPVPGRNSTPLGSPRVSSVSPQEQPTRVSSASPLQQKPTPIIQSVTSSNIDPSKQSSGFQNSPLSTNLLASKSSASQRRQRALSSHPSNNSLASRPSSSSSDKDVPVASIPAPQVRSRLSHQKTRKSTDSRIPQNPSFTSLAPTPAPKTPLPQLPPHALTSDPESDAMPKPPPEAHVPVDRHLNPKAHHSQMASFMTTTQTMVFRRFDDVHVQLLLCLQDEISDLERKLNELDSTSTTRNDRTMERVQVIRELRRVVGEYDQLFASWSSMQATKASKSTIASLKQWLERRQTSVGAGLGVGAQEDLLWLEGAKDLSSVHLGRQNAGKERESRLASGPGKRLGLFASCAGNRKKGNYEEE